MNVHRLERNHGQIDRNLLHREVSSSIAGHACDDVRVRLRGSDLGCSAGGQFDLARRGVGPGEAEVFERLFLLHLDGCGRGSARDVTNVGSCHGLLRKSFGTLRQHNLNICFSHL